MKKSYLVVGILVVAVLYLLIFGNPFSSLSGQSTVSEPTVAEFQKDFCRKVDKELSSRDNDIRKRIEAAHATVTVKDAYVSFCRMTTRDGSDNAGRNGSNISNVNFTIHTVWDGIFHKNGYTDLQIVLDVHGDKADVRTSEIVDTNAMINVEDPNFWYAVGATTAILLL